MNKNLLTEISRMKEIMGLSLINEGLDGFTPQAVKGLEYLGIKISSTEARAAEELYEKYNLMSATARRNIEEIGELILQKNESLIGKQLERTLANPAVEKQLVELILSKSEDGGAKFADEIIKAKLSPERYEQLSLLFQDPKYKQKALDVLEKDGVLTPENEPIFKSWKPKSQPIESVLEKEIDNYFEKIGVSKEMIDIVISEGTITKKEFYNLTKKSQAEFEKLPKEEQKKFADSVMNELERLAKKESVGSAAFYPGSGSGSGTPKPPPPGTEGFQKVLYYVKNTPSLLLYGGLSIAVIYIMVVLLGNLKCIRHKSIGEVLLQCVLGVDDDEDENNSDNKDNKDNNKKKKEDETSEPEWELDPTTGELKRKN